MSSKKRARKLVKRIKIISELLIGIAAILSAIGNILSALLKK